MILFKKVTDLRNYLDAMAISGKSAGFVPTMGALHPGHISLAETCKKQNDITVCSIFVNPAQFNDPVDFEKYPVTIEKDIQLLEKAGCDVLFLPSVKEIYPDASQPVKHYELGYLETILEGKFRPGHYQGVCRVMERLLEIVRPQQLYLGQKDFQQCMVITRLIQQMGLHDKIKINICPTLRERDGLAMSSRNVRLGKDEREKAPSIYKVLQYVKDNIESKAPHSLKQEAIKKLTDEGFKVDYVEISEADSLHPLQQWDKKKITVVLVAAFMNEVRLIDNVVIPAS